LKISIIVPAHNEEKNISNCLKKLINHFSKTRYSYEIIVSEDGSTDKTFEIARKFEKKNKKIKVLHSKKRLGKGGGIIKGFKQATGDIVIFTDADLSALPPEMNKLIDEINSGTDVAIASKYTKDSKIPKKPPLKKRLAGKFFNFVVNLFFNFGIKDTQCGLKAIRKNVLDKIISELNVTGWGFDIEFLLRTKQHKFKIKEVPITWSHREKTTKFSFLSDSFHMGFNVFNLWLKENFNKSNILFIILFLSFFFGCLFLFNSRPIADEGTHNLIGLFFYDLLTTWVKYPTLSFSKIYDFTISYLVHYPKVSLYYPPLYYFILSIMYRVFGVLFFTGSLTTLFFSLGTLLTIFLFSKNHLKNSKIGLTASLIFGLTPIIIFLSIKSMTDIPVLFFFLLSIYSYLNAIKTNKIKNFIIFSILFTFGFLTKWTIVLVLPIIFIYSIMHRKCFKKLIISFILIGIFLSPYIFLAYKTGSLLLPLKSSIISPGFRERDPQYTSLEGWLYYPKILSNEYFTLPLFILALLSLVVYCKTKQKYWKLFLIWFVVTYLFFTWLPNKDHRYISVLFPSLLFPYATILNFIKNKKIMFGLLFLICIFLLSVNYHYLKPFFESKINFNQVIGEVTKEDGNILLATETSEFYSSTFIFNLAETEVRYAKKVFRPCVLENITLKDLLDDEGIRYVIVAYPIREYYENNVKIVSNTSQLELIKTIEDKESKISIYKNVDYREFESKCNYICILNDWICSNYENPIKSFES